MIPNNSNNTSLSNINQVSNVNGGANSGITLSNLDTTVSNNNSDSNSTTPRLSSSGLANSLSLSMNPVVSNIDKLTNFPDSNHSSRVVSLNQPIHHSPLTNQVNLQPAMTASSTGNATTNSGVMKKITHFHQRNYLDLVNLIIC
ncbi:unnamed protein product [[Candida] boidinii]|nr:unnamed protein product [[Candida] boidinii]